MPNPFRYQHEKIGDAISALDRAVSRDYYTHEARAER